MKKFLLFLFTLLMSASAVYAAGDGSKENPYSLADLKEQSVANNTTCWVKGYIIGSWSDPYSRWWVSEINTSADGANDNIVLADTPTETDPANVLFAQNNYVNAVALSSKPEILGKQVALKCQVLTLAGRWSINLNINYGSADEYYFIEGGEEPDPEPDPTPDPTPDTEGDGTEENPFTIDQVLAKGSITDMQWVKGYLVGVAAGSLTALETVFEIPTSGNYPYLIIAPSVDCKDVKKSLVLVSLTAANKEVLDINTKFGKKFALSIGNVIAAYNAVGNVYAAKELTEGGGEDPVEEATEVTFDFTVAGFANGTAMTDSIKDGITLHPDAGGNSNVPKYYNTGTAMRFYPNNTLTVSTASQKYNIVKIDFVTDKDGAFAENIYNLSAGSLSISSTTAATWSDANGVKSLVITPSTASKGHVRVQKMTIYLAEPGEQFAEAPVFSPESQVIEKNSLVTLTSATPGAKIYYTTDGKDPKVGDANTSLYTEPGIMITANTTIKAMATADGMTNSPVVTKGYMVPVEVKTIEEFMANADEVNWYKITGALTVTYANGPRCFVKDNTASLLLYSSDFSTMELPNGTLIDGLIGKYTRYLGMIPEMEDIITSSIKTLTGAPVNPTESTVADITNSSMNEYLIVKNAVITKHAEQDNADNKYGKNYWTITDETGSQTLYNQFGIEIAETPDGKVADVIVIPSYYSNAIQLYAISYTEKDAPTQGGDEGDGTEANPYTIDQILAMGQVNDLSWIKGYLVGVAGGSPTNWETVWGVPHIAAGQRIQAPDRSTQRRLSGCEEVARAL